MATIWSKGVARERAALQADITKDVGLPIGITNWEKIMFFIEYTRGNAGGLIRYTVEFSDDKINWYTYTTVQNPAIVAGSDTVSPTQRDSLLYTSTSANTERFVSPVFPVVADWCRVLACDTISPRGTAYIKYYLVGDN